MTATPFRTHIEGEVEVDICWPCHLIWFDHMESVAMSAQSVIDLFKQIHAHRADERQVVSLTGNCPTCNSALLQSFDFSRTGRFQYHRCPTGHGRLITFMQFLREKHFVRTLSPSEVRTLAITVRQIRCSSCGAGIDITHDAACTHCAAPVAVLDEAAVAKALADLDARRDKRQAVSAPLPDAYMPPASRQSASSTSGFEPELVDLLVTGVAAILSITLD